MVASEGAVGVPVHVRGCVLCVRAAAYGYMRANIQYAWRAYMWRTYVCALRKKQRVWGEVISEKVALLRE